MNLPRWFRRRFMRCDGCRGIKGQYNLNPASGDTYLCDTCLTSVMMFGKYPHELSWEQGCILAVEMENEP